MANFTHQKKLALLFVAPQLTITVLFFVWPALKAVIQAFFYSDPFGIQQHFAGLHNFLDLKRDPTFPQALWVTCLLAFFITFLTMSLGLLLAVLVQSTRRAQSTYKTLLIWPYAVAPAVAAMLWRFLWQPALGWFSIGLNHLGIDFNYLSHPKQALLVIVIVGSWQQLSYNFLFYLAALKAVPSSLIDAAMLDGSTGWRRFWHIVWPLLSPTSFFLLMINIIYAFFDTFGIIDVLTSGGPGIATTTLIYKIYKDGFIGMDLGSSAAQSVILMVMVGLITFFQFHYIEKKVHYA